MPTLSLKLSKEVYERLERIAKERGATVYQLVKELVTSFARGDLQQVCVSEVDIKKPSSALEDLDSAIGWFFEVHDDIERVFKVIKQLYEDKLLELNVALAFAHNELSEVIKTSSKQGGEGASHA
jgi:predicted CopG family antitoxin